MAILAPLWINLWGQQPFELPKAALVRTLVWLLTGMALAEGALNGQPLWAKLRAVPLLGPVVLLTLVIATTTATSVDWRLSLWGSYERSQGAVTLLTYLLLLMLAASRFQSIPHARETAAAMAAAGAPLLLFSYAQAAGWNLLGLLSDARSPVYATLGRANFAGAYLAILLPVTLALLLTTRGRLRLAWALLFVGELVGIGLTLARSAWLAAAVALALFALLWYGPRLARPWRRLAWSGIAIFFLSGPLAVLTLGRFQLGSTAARLSIWHAAVDLIAQRPLLGYGPETTGIVFPRVYPPELIYLQGRDYFVDRAHNLALDWTLTAGIPGLLAYALLLITFCFVIVQALGRPQSTQRRALLIATLSAVLGNAANNLTSFDVTPTATATWLLMGMGAALAAPPSPSLAAAPAHRNAWRWAFVVALCAGIGAAIWQINVRPLQADIAARASHLHAQAGDWAKAAAAADRAAAHWPIEPAHQLLRSQAYWQRAVADPAGALHWLAQAEDALQAARQLRPLDPLVWLNTAQFYTSAARPFGSDTDSLAAEAFDRALTLSPNSATIYAAWGHAALESGDVETAAAMLRQAVALDATGGEAYLYLGAAEAALGRLEIALAAYQEAVRLLPESSSAHTGVAAAYWRLGRSADAMAAVERALQLDPSNAQAAALRRDIRDYLRLH